jgi:glycosyl transferase family 1
VTTRIVTTVPPDLPTLEHSFDHHGEAVVETIDRRQTSRIRYVRSLLDHADSAAVLLLNGSGRQDQLAAVLLQRRRRVPPIVISDCTWRAKPSTLGRLVRRVGLSLIDSPRVTYCVLSSAELELFPQSWPVDRSRIVFTPFCYTVPPAELARGTQRGEGIFAGGDSMRDYGPLLAAVASIGVPLRLAVQSNVPKANGIPSVTMGPVPRAEFFAEMSRARVVVVPLAPGIERSAGQQTILNGMALGKIVVATDSPGTRDHLRHGETGYIVAPGDAGAMEQTLRHVLDPANEPELAAVRERACATARSEFSPESYVERLLDLALQAIDS